MADFNIEPVATKIKPVEGMSLGEMIRSVQGIQSYRQAEQLNPLKVEQAKAELSRLQQLTPEELKKAIAEAKVAEQTATPRIETAKAQQTKAETEATGSVMELQSAKMKKIADSQIGMINDPLIIAAERGENVDPSVLAAKVKQNGMRIAKDLGIPEDQAQSLISPYLEIAQNNPKQLRQYFKQRHIEGLDQSARTSAVSASGMPISTGAKGYAVQTGEFGPIAPGTVIPGTAYEQELAPSTETITPSGERKLLGPITQRKPGQVTTGLAPQQAATLEAAGKVIAEDLPRTIAEAKDAPARIGIFQNIKKLTPEAFTGPTADRRQATASFAQMLGIPAYQLETSSTDELMKNTKLLQMAGGNTDAARALAEFANPNNKMSKEGILRVTNQLIGIENMRTARARYLTPAQNDANEYMNRKQAFDSISDPRLFQEMDKADAQKMWNSMSKSEQQQILKMRDQARALGVIK
jgi:hypothetical protein